MSTYNNEVSNNNESSCKSSSISNFQEQSTETGKNNRYSLPLTNQALFNWIYERVQGEADLRNLLLDAYKDIDSNIMTKNFWIGKP
jgi:hypothetical protein